MSHASKDPLRLGTRGSALARWQADWVASRLAELGIDVELVLIRTGGDVDSRPIGSIGGEGVFTKELHRALLAAQVDLAVHSLKDLPTEAVAGLTLAAVPPRMSPNDALVSRDARLLDSLATGARVGTGSQRRRAQLLYCRRDLAMAEIRGNVDSRLRKLDEGQYDAIVLAEAGLLRLGLEERISQVLPPDVMLPAPGQGALGLECRSDDTDTRQILRALDAPAARQGVLAERALLAMLRGGCSAPVGAWGRAVEDQLQLDAVVLSADGQRRLFVHVAGSVDEPEKLGRAAADELLRQGAAELIPR